MNLRDREIYAAFADYGFHWHGRLAIGLIWAIRVATIGAVAMVVGNAYHV